MKAIGFMYNYSENKPITKYYGLFRIIPIANYLREYGIELQVYSPKHVNPDTKMVMGYLVGENGLIPKIFPIPKINGNWYTGMNRSKLTHTMGKDEFREWHLSHGISTYPPYELCSFVKNKLTSYEALNDNPGILQPVTELYQGTQTQVESLLTLSSTVFFKPWKGNKGDNIYILKQLQGKFIVHYYLKRQVEEFLFSTLKDASQFINKRTAKHKFIIQQGLDSILYEQRPFIFRAILLNDGDRWHWLHKVVVAKHKSDIANTTQDSTNFFTKDLLTELFGREEAARLLRKLKSTCFTINDTLSQKFSEPLNENAFDLMIDKQKNFHLIELNTQPGMTKPGLPLNYKFKNLFSPEGEEKKYYDTTVKPHGILLGKFLKYQLDKWLEEHAA